MLDAKHLSVEKSINKKPMLEVMEEARGKLVAALKLGTRLVVFCNDGCPDFAQSLTDESDDSKEIVEGGSKAFFPLEVFKCAGKGLVKDPAWADKLFREGEADDEMCKGITPADRVSSAGDGFEVVVVTRFHPDIMEGDDEAEFEGCVWGHLCVCACVFVRVCLCVCVCLCLVFLSRWSHKYCLHMLPRCVFVQLPLWQRLGFT